MKNFRTTSILLFVIAVFYSCKKETVSTQSKSADAGITSEDATTGSKWQGAFISLNGLPASRKIPDRLFIKDGYARIYNDSIRISSTNYYSTQFRLLIPDNIRIKGDSVNFEIGVKNPLNSSFFIPYHGRDVGLYIKGETNTATINNAVTDDIRPGAGEFAFIQIGETKFNNIQELQYVFDDWGTLLLQTFNRGLWSYRNDSVYKGIAYYGEPLIGRLREIGISFKGSGYIDYVRIYNSVNGKLLMSEDFNTDGVSTVVWY